MTQTIEQLTARVRELEEENARLRDAVRQQESHVFREQATSLDIYQQLAASQLRETQLRDALTKIEYLESDNGCILSAGDCSSLATEALATPTSTEALDAYVAEKVKEATLPVADELQAGRLQWMVRETAADEKVTTLTRQRDLAVDVLKTAYEVATNHDDRIPFDWAVYCEMLWQAIKESDGK